MDACFCFLAAASVFIQIKKKREWRDPIGYGDIPSYPSVFITLQMTFCYQYFFSKPEQAVPGLILLMVGAGLFYWFKKTSRIT